MLETKNSLSKKIRTEMCAALNARLADAVDLLTQVKAAHWNVKGPSFIALHELFDKVYGVVEEAVDELAERVVQLGGTAAGTARVAARKSKLKEYPDDIFKGSDHVAAVAERLGAFGATIRTAIDHAAAAGDAGTADLFTEISRGIDKMLWMVEAHGQAKD